MNRDFFDELYMQSNVPRIEKIQKELDLVKNLDKQIEQLVYQRSLVLGSAKMTGLELSDPKLTIMVNSAELEKAYNKDGFSSETVKSAVNNVRTFFFDDALEKFQKFDCTEIDFGDNYDHSIKFEFSDGSDYEIGISIPCLEFGYDSFSYGRTYKNYTNSEKRLLFDSEFIGGKISFYVKYKVVMTKDTETYTRRECETIEYSYDMFKLRKAIRDFILRDASITPAKYPKFQFNYYSFIDMIGKTMDLEIETKSY